MSGRLSGEEKVFAGPQFVADAHYDIQIQPQYRNTSSMDGDGKLFVGNIVHMRISPVAAISRYFGTEKLTLHLNDGRKQDFFVSSAAGECRATGGPYS